MSKSTSPTSAIGILHQFGIRPSHQRVAVLKHLLEHRNHSTADEIYESLQSYMPVISRTTVYNTLRLFQQAGVIQALSIGNNPLAFDANNEPHAHLYCRNCNKIVDIPIPPDEWMRIKDYAGSSEYDMQILFKGICHECSHKP